jgi:hypothetical protein
MGNTVEVTIPVDADAPQALKSPARRAAAGRYLSVYSRVVVLAISLRRPSAKPRKKRTRLD